MTTRWIHALKGAAAAAIAGALLLSASACSSKSDTNSTANGSGSATTITVKIGTLQTDDILPLWAAVDDGTAAANGLDLQIQTFQSAQDQSNAIVGGALDGLMTDMVVPVALTANGTKLKAITKLQGAPAGIVSGKDSGISTVKDLSGVKTGISSATAMEYIYDSALEDAGVSDDQIVSEEVKSIPLRLESLNNGSLKAAVLPWTMYQVALGTGANSVLDQQGASKYQSTMLAMSDTFLAKPNAAEAVKRILKTQDEEVAKINANPENYRALLAEKASLPDSLKDSFPIRQYPTSGLPEKALWEDVISWIVKKGYISSAISYDDLVYQS